MEKYYIAYGSNLNTKQMSIRCSGAKVAGTGFLKDYQLIFKGSLTGAYLTIEKAEGKSVPVAIWEVSEENEKALDRYEGYPSFYYKKEMEIELTEIKTKKTYRKQAFVYIMHEERKLGIPYKDYLLVCLEGYKTFKFNSKYLEEALKNSMEVKNANSKYGKQNLS